MKTMNEMASASMIVLFFIIIFLGVFAWMGSGFVVDKLVKTQTDMAQGGMPMSQDRLNLTNWLLIGFQAILVLGIVLPVIVYAVAVSRRRDDSLVM
jgi:hypothetical protein